MAGDSVVEASSSLFSVAVTNSRTKSNLRSEVYLAYSCMSQSMGECQGGPTSSTGVEATENIAY